MFKRLTAIVLLVALISANCSRLFVYAGFELNHNYIAETLCINKSRPWLHCNGKCYFMKKIKQAEENEKKQTEKDNLSRLEISFFQEPFTISFRQPLTIEPARAALPAYTCHVSSRYLDTIFRPPRAVV